MVYSNLKSDKQILGRPIQRIVTCVNPSAEHIEMENPGEVSQILRT